MRAVSVTRIATPSVVITLAMSAAALVVAAGAGFDGSRLPLAYLMPALGFGAIVVPAWMVALALVLARRRKRFVLVGVLRRYSMPKLPGLILALIVVPVFLAAFTTTKAGIWTLTGFRWDRTFADMDASIFGTDPWRLTHTAFGPFATRLLELTYTLGWGFAFAIANLAIALQAPRQKVAVYFLAMLSCWFLGGFVLAYLFSSAGPVFAQFSDPDLGERFRPLREQLAISLAPHSPIRLTQAYLASAIDAPIVARGGGISAMPSMHIGAMAIIALAARGTRWLWPAVIFVVLIWIGSVHFGYHYAVDGLAAIAIAFLCWKCAERVFDDERTFSSSEVPSTCPVPGSSYASLSDSESPTPCATSPSQLGPALD